MVAMLARNVEIIAGFVRAVLVLVRVVQVATNQVLEDTLVVVRQVEQQIQVAISTCLDKVVMDIYNCGEPQRQLYNFHFLFK